MPTKSYAKRTAAMKSQWRSHMISDSASPFRQDSKSAQAPVFGPDTNTRRDPRLPQRHSGRARVALFGGPSRASASSAILARRAGFNSARISSRAPAGAVIVPARAGSPRRDGSGARLRPSGLKTEARPRHDLGV